MGISDNIARLIEAMLNDSGGELELKRNDLAGKVGCVPSQINYVISSRFTPERGYIIESKRGGGGYIRIIRRHVCKDEYLMHFFCAIGDKIDEQSAQAFIGNLEANGFLSGREARIADIAVSAAPDDTARADVMKQLALAIMK